MVISSKMGNTNKPDALYSHPGENLYSIEAFTDENPLIFVSYLHYKVYDYVNAILMFMQSQFELGKEKQVNDKDIQKLKEGIRRIINVVRGLTKNNDIISHMNQFEKNHDNFFEGLDGLSMTKEVYDGILVKWRLINFYPRHLADTLIKSVDMKIKGVLDRNISPVWQLAVVFWIYYETWMDIINMNPININFEEREQSKQNAENNYKDRRLGIILMAIFQKFVFFNLFTLDIAAKRLKFLVENNQKSTKNKLFMLLFDIPGRFAILTYNENAVQTNTRIVSNRVDGAISDGSDWFTDLVKNHLTDRSFFLNVTDPIMLTISCLACGDSSQIHEIETGKRYCQSICQYQYHNNFSAFV